MSAGKLSLYLEQGVDESWVLTIEDSTGAPVNLTGYTFRGQIRAFALSSVILGSFSFGFADQSIPANLGKVTMSLSAAISSAMVLPVGPADKYFTAFYDVEMVGSVITRAMEGPVRISLEVTR